jgi:hypothetical protein
MSAADRGEAAEQPERHRRKLAIRVGEILHHADTGAEQGTDHDAGQHQHQDRIARPYCAADGVHGGNGEQSAEEGLDREHTEREVDAEHGSERRARRSAENVRRH